MPNGGYRRFEAGERVVETDMRPFTIQLPTWDGKIGLAAVFIVGYYLIVFSMARIGLPAENKEIVRDAMLQLGPPIGVIIGALFRSTAAEERREALRSSDFKAALDTPAMSDTTSFKEAVKTGVKEGLENAEPVETTSALPPKPLSADGIRREWLDPPPITDPPASTPAPNGPTGSTPVLED